MKITIIGAGNMGGAIAKGLYNASVFQAADIVCADKSAAILESISTAIPGSYTTTDNIEAVKDADIVLFAVKPWILPLAIDEVKEVLDYNKQMIISIVAGIGTDKLRELFKKNDESVPGIIYLIPNIAVEVGEGVFLYTTQNATAAQIECVQNIFGKLGLAKQVEEKQMVAGTALSSCGIAYVFRYIRACVEGGVEMGFYPKDAQEIVLQTIKGAAELLMANHSHPEQEIDKVTTPGGITIKGLNAMEEAGFTNAVIKGLKAGK